MKQISIYDSSMRFSRAAYGALALIAFLIQNYWLVLATSIIVFIGVFSLGLNVAYQIHALFLRKIFKDKSQPVQRDWGEIRFVSGMIGVMLFASFLILYIGKFTGFVWTVILIISLLYFLACFAGICIASLMYAFFGKLFRK